MPYITTFAEIGIDLIKFSLLKLHIGTQKIDYATVVVKLQFNHGIKVELPWGNRTACRQEEWILRYVIESGLTFLTFIFSKRLIASSAISQCENSVIIEIQETMFCFSISSNTWDASSTVLSLQYMVIRALAIWTYEHKSMWIDQKWVILPSKRALDPKHALKRVTRVISFGSDEEFCIDWQMLKHDFT